MPQDGEALMASDTLSKAKKAKNDEFYTQFHDIEAEINSYLAYDPDVFRGKTVLLPCDDPESSNFTRFFVLKFKELGLKKLISTSYAHVSKHVEFPYQLSLFEREAEQFDESKTRTHGKIFVLTGDRNHDGKIDVDDLDWRYLKDDGDFRSEEVKALRDETDIIVTNPPFSLFREFFAWIMEDKKKFLIVGNKNAITYKEIFPYIQANEVWLGARGVNKDMWLIVPKTADYEKSEGGKNLKHINACWFTNIDHGRRHTPMVLMSEDDNIRFSKHKEVYGQVYARYDNYEAIDVPFVDAIPSDHEGVMGVPITFLGQYCPEQFEILGLDRYVEGNPNYGKRFTINGKETYARILIRHRRIEQ